MTFAQARDIWNMAGTVSRGVNIVTLRSTVRLRHDSEDTFTIRHKDCDIIILHKNDTYTIDFGQDKGNCEYYRRDLITHYVFDEGV